MLDQLPGVQHAVTLAPYTTFNIGGPAEYFIVVKTAEQLRQTLAAAQQDGISWAVLGGGSDVLVSDKGIRGLVIKMELRDVLFNDAQQQVRAGAGVLLSALVRQCLQHELTGLEYTIGVPATVGGAVWANVGARGHAIAEVVMEVTAIDPQGISRRLSVADCQYGYRDSIFKHERLIIVDALFQLQRGTNAESQRLIRELSSLRSATQDISAQCAGCVFRNPKDQTTIPAAKLIDELGLKGKSIGGAQVSTVHANFIINTGMATADDVVQLISYVKQQVRDKKGVQLMEEIEYMGFE